jgi:hypothetical protein
MFVHRLAEKMFLPTVTLCHGTAVLIVGGHAPHVRLRIVALAAFRNNAMTLLLPHSAHIGQPLYDCVFGAMKPFFRRERRSRGSRGEMRRLYRSLCDYFTSTVLNFVRFSFFGAGLALSPDAPRGPIIVNTNVVMARTA